MMTSSIGVYIHTPFCKSKCPYCDFYSVAFDDTIADRYVDAVVAEIKSAPSFVADTVYFGGGTPSLLGEKRLGIILDSLSDKLTNDCEITLECNPKTVDLVLLEKYYTIGINRLSIGVQSFHDNELKRLGRIHSSDDAKQIVYEAQKSGFENISIDLMLSTPEQTIASMTNSLNTAISLGVKHISAYMLTLEQGTPLYTENPILPNEDEVAKGYLKAVSMLNNAGLLQYEVSNFAKIGYESRHNLKYWNGDEYLGFGASAHSYFAGVRYCHDRNIEEYITTKGQNRIVTDNKAGSFSEYAMLRLRLTQGLNFDEVKKRYNTDLTDIIKKAEQFKKAGLLDITDTEISLTPKGFLVSNELISRLVI